MLSMDERQRGVDYWRGIHDARQLAKERFDTGERPAPPPVEIPHTPYTGPFIEDYYAKYYDREP